MAEDIYVICRLRDFTDEYWADLYWTQDVRFARQYILSDPPTLMEPGTDAFVPFIPALNQNGVCLVAQDNPRIKECIRHGSTTSN